MLQHDIYFGYNEINVGRVLVIKRDHQASVDEARGSASGRAGMTLHWFSPSNIRLH